MTRAHDVERLDDQFLQAITRATIEMDQLATLARSAIAADDTRGVLWALEALGRAQNALIDKLIDIAVQPLSGLPRAGRRHARAQIQKKAARLRQSLAVKLQAARNRVSECAGQLDGMIDGFAAEIADIFA